MAGLPLRGPGVRDCGRALPPDRMRAWRRGRPLKRWRYVGVFTPALALCVGDARIGPVPQRWWAVATPDGELRERTTFGRGGVEVQRGQIRVRSRDASIELRLDEGAGIEVASPVGADGGYAWTRKQAGIPVRGVVQVDGKRHSIMGDYGFVDESAGYHARHTAWRWSAGIGTAEDGRPVGWNLVAGIHDDPIVSERTLWVDGESAEVGPVAFAPDLASIGFEGGQTLAFAEWSAREHSTNALLLRSRYRQPFGSFSGELPGALRLTAGYGVMEEHDVHW